MNDEHLVLRPAGPADAAVIADVYNETIRAGTGTMDTVEKTADEIRAQMAAFTDREGYLLLERDGAAVGWSVVKRHSDRPGYRFCAETSVYLRHAERRRGYGSRLQAAVMDQCRAFGYHHLVAKIWAGNAASIAFHERFGYEVVGIQREIGYVGGSWQDVAILQCLLDGGGP